MKRLLSIPMALGCLFLLLIAFNSVNAVSVGASFRVMNSTLGINQNLFFNISATGFQQNVTYDIYLNNASVTTGLIPANSVGYQIVKYNVTNTLTGNYNASIKFSTLSSRIPIYSNITTHIRPHAAFDFPDYSNRTFIVNNSARLSLLVSDIGNTPLAFSWSLPAPTGVYFRLTNYTEIFSLVPSQTLDMPINMTLKGNFSKVLNFSFVAVYSNITIRDNYITTLFTPVINLTFLGNSVATHTGAPDVYSVDVENGDNLPVNVTFEFLLDLSSYNGANTFYLNKSYLLSPSTTKVQIDIPNSSQLLEVNVFYVGQDDKLVSEQIFDQPLPNPSALSNLLADIAYVVILGGAIVVLAYLHYRHSKNKKP